MSPQNRHERKTAKSGEQLFRTLCEASSEGVAIHENGTILDASQRFAAMFGYELSEAIGMHAVDFAAPESRDLVLRNILSKGDQPYEATLLRRDRSTFPAEICARAVLYDGRTVRVVAIRDITKRKRAQEALRQERDTAQKYLDVAEVMLVAVNRDEEVTLINRKGRRLLGCEEEDILGKNWFDSFLPAEAREEVRCVFRKLMAGEMEPMEYFENPVLTRSGERRLIAWHNTVLTDEAGHIIATLSSGDDISERKRAEEALQEAREKLESRVERRMRRGSAYGLTFRELTVLHLVVAGKSDKEIAATLGISPLTASKHLANILHKMGAAGRIEAGVRAVREGLLD